MSELVTVVITSCGRWDLLEKTVDSFMNMYSGPRIANWIIVEDSGNPDIKWKIEMKYKFMDLYFHEIPHGQLRCIDEAYSKVKTPYILHLEDDWFFHTPGDFIKESIEYLEKNSQLIQIWIRDNSDNPHKAEYLVPEWEGWNGFSFNPGVRRKSDYDKIKPYAQYKDEREIDNVYKKLGYCSLILPQTYCYHIGYNRSHYTKKKCIINQYRGIGDILFIEPLCRWLNEGYDITFPVDDQYYWIKDYIPYINFVKKSEYFMDYEKFSWGKIGEFEYFPIRFANPLLRGYGPHDYSDQFNCMKDKYRLFGKDPDMWKGLKWKRNHDKENELFNFLGLEGKEYTLINEYSSQGKVTIVEDYLSAWSWNKTVVYQQQLPGFTLLDWAKVIENATYIHTTSTSNFYMIETLDLKAKELHLYKRITEDLTAVSDLMTKNWILHED
jgi:hypothetical protein